MKLKTFLYSSVLVTGLSGLVGCQPKEPVISDSTSYFANLPMDYRTGIGLVAGDFDNDGDLDLIAGARHPDVNKGARLYFLENDGKGNFKIRRDSSVKYESKSKK